MNKRLRKSLVKRKSINDRLLSARLNSTRAMLKDIVCYASTEVSEDEQKNVFYNKLQEAIKEISVHGVLLVLTDLVKCYSRPRKQGEIKE